MDLDGININLVTSEVSCASLSFPALPTSLGQTPPGTAPGGSLDLKPLEIKVSCNTDGEKTKRNIQANLKRNHTVVDVIPEHNRVAILVGGGPSLKDGWPEVAGWRFRGADVFALNGAAKFLNQRGVLPQYQVMIDPRPQNKALIGIADEHIFASQCHPSLFKVVRNPVMMHLYGSAMGLVNGTLIGGNITAGLVAMCLAHTLGFREMHLYGYDSSYADDAHHAYDQQQSDQEQKRLEVITHDGQGQPHKFTTNYAMAKQAEMFPETARLLTEAGSVIMVHGTGLLPTIAHGMRKPAAQAA